MTPHGFGHAARAAAVIEAMRRLRPELAVEIFTTVPEWFFNDSLLQPAGYHRLDTDLGMVQRNALVEDPGATAAQLRQRLPFATELLDRLAEQLESLSCDLVIADIAPLGLAVARHLGLPSVLVENFTWDWIYRGYRQQEPALLPFADLLGEIFASAEYRFQAAPVCVPAAGARTVGPVSRQPRWDRQKVRRELKISDHQPMVLLTMGGLSWQHSGLAELADNESGPWVVIPGGGEERRAGRLLLLPHRSRFYHPDLIGAADAVLGKLGYSTVAEVYRAGLPFAYVPRPGFPESAPLEAWVCQQMNCLAVEPHDLQTGRWDQQLDKLLALGRSRPELPEGASQIAQEVIDLWPATTAVGR